MLYHDWRPLKLTILPPLIEADALPWPRKTDP